MTASVSQKKDSSLNGRVPQAPRFVFCNNSASSHRQQSENHSIVDRPSPFFIAHNRKSLVIPSCSLLVVAHTVSFSSSYRITPKVEVIATRRGNVVGCEWVRFVAVYQSTQVPSGQRRHTVLTYYLVLMDWLVGREMMSTWKSKMKEMKLEMYSKNLLWTVLSKHMA